MDEPFMNPGAIPEAGDYLTRAILARTSGSPCQRLREQACAYVDGELDEGRGGLMRAHMEHCPACASLVAALEASRVVLPKMAQVDPAPWFTQRVMRATAYAPRAASPDLRALWWKLVHRPRIALETAFLGAAASMLGLVIPLPTLPPSLRLPALVQPLKASAQRVAAPVARAEQRVSTTLKRTFVPGETTPSQSLWQRWTRRIRARWQAMGKAKDKAPQAPNP